jgi:hypothetical protein
MSPAAMQLHELSSLISSALAICNQEAEEAEEFQLPLDEMARDLSAAITELSGQLLGGQVKKKKPGKKPPKS